MLATAAHSTISYAQAIIIAVIQGITELVPISSLGHSVILPALFGWTGIVQSQSQSESAYLAFLVGLHVGTATALVIYYWRDWHRIVVGILTSIRDRQIETSAQRLGWLLVIATIPVGVVGLLFEHTLRTQFAKPIAAAIFLTINGVILLAGELVRRRALKTHGLDENPAHAAIGDDEAKGWTTLSNMSFSQALIIGSSQILALLAGISRSGVTMVTGLIRGLDHEDAAKFAFLLATPVIMLAGIYKIGDVTGPNGNGIRGQIIVGTIVAGVAAYLTVRFLSKYFETRTLWPFGVYCLVFGGFCIFHFA